MHGTQQLQSGPRVVATIRLRSVEPAAMAIVNTADISAGSAIAAMVISRLLPIAPKSAGRIQAAQREKKTPEGQQPDQGEHAAEQAQRRLHGHHRHQQSGQQRRNEHDVGRKGKDPRACSEITMSLPRNFRRSRYGCQTGGPRRFCSRAFQFLMMPVTSGASASNSTVCKTSL